MRDFPDDFSQKNKLKALKKNQKNTRFFSRKMWSKLL